MIIVQPEFVHPLERDGEKGFFYCRVFCGSFNYLLC